MAVSSVTACKFMSSNEKFITGCLPFGNRGMWADEFICDFLVTSSMVCDVVTRHRTTDAVKSWKCKFHGFTSSVNCFDPSYSCVFTGHSYRNDFHIKYSNIHNTAIVFYPKLKQDDGGVHTHTPLHVRVSCSPMPTQSIKSTHYARAITHAKRPNNRSEWLHAPSTDHRLLLLFT